VTTASLARQLLFISTAAAPTPLVPILTLGDINHAPYVADAVERPQAGVVGVGLSALHAAPRATTSFSVGLVGSGTAGTAPVIGPILKACALAAVTTPTTKVEYSHVDLIASSTTDAVNITVNESGEQQTSTGNRGTVTLTFPAAGIPTAQFEMTGGYADPTAVTYPAPPDFSGQSLYKLVDQNTTLTLTTEGDEIALCFENFTITQAAATQVFALGGCAQAVAHTDIMMTWSATAIRPALADFDLWAVLKSRESFDIELKHGIFTGPSANPGYRVTVQLTGATLDENSKTQINNKVARSMSGVVLSNDFLLRFD
jgi:hypothetical protein